MAEIESGNEAQIADPQTESVLVPQEASMPWPKHHSTILLAEDNEDDILLMQRAFAKARLANPLRVVHDGDEAIRYLTGEEPYADRHENPFPLMMLLDLHLPKVDGFEVLHWLRDKPELDGLIVVVLTSSTD